jgi:signal transduction histidine kinase/ActR/RegA family two-component response regulator
LRAAQEAGRSGEKQSLELQLQRPQEQPLWVRADIEADRDEQDAVLQWRMVLVDISERKLLEAKQEAYQEQQLQAKKMASIGRLAGGVAHEFNNILQGMLGNVELLQMKKPTDDPDNKYLQQFCGHIFRAKEIVDALLTMSSQAAMNLQPIDLNAAVSQSLEVLKQNIPGHIRLKEHLCCDPLPIEADPGQISQMITHLVENAFDAIPVGKTGSVEIRTERGSTSFAAPWRSGEEPAVVLHVEDSGWGMSQEIQKDVFDPFFTTKDVGMGTGLGLSTVYSIVQLHGGKIAMSSRPDQGTRCTVHLPERRPRGESGASSEMESPEVHASQGEKGTILVVEDEDDIRDVLSEFLRLQGFAVIEATDGESAYRIFQENRGHIDLVVLDLGIPGIDGEEFIKNVHQLQAKAKIIVASGYTQHRMASDPEGFGVSAFLGKPFNLQAALHTIQATLSQ